MLHQIEFHAMGCTMHGIIDRERKPESLAYLPEWFEEWEQILSRFRYDSELSRLNQIHERPVPVSTTLWDVLQAARTAERFTDGLVTPTLLDALIEAGYDRPFEVLSQQITYTSTPSLLAPAPLNAMDLNAAAQTVTLPTGMSLDFGGIAKGWCADQAMKRLQTDGPTLVNAGGDIAISGPRADGSEWQIGISNPFGSGGEIGTIYLNACGIATSGKDRRRWTRDGILKHHIIDPLTALPAETDLLTVTVVAPSVMEAEAAAKAAFILGSHAGMEWIESQPGLAALFILDDAQLLYSRTMEEFL